MFLSVYIVDRIEFAKPIAVNLMRNICASDTPHGVYQMVYSPLVLG